MLVLTRKQGQRILLYGGDVVITVVRVGPNNVRIGIDAPPECNIVREELVERSTFPPITQDYDEVEP